MRKTHRYRRLFASDLLKVDKDTENVAYDNNRAKQLNQIEKLVVEKPKVIKEKKKPVEKIIEDEVVEEEPPKELKRSSRGQIPNRQPTDLGFIEKKKRKT
jgi:hypothetical protein